MKIEVIDDSGNVLFSKEWTDLQILEAVMSILRPVAVADAAPASAAESAAEEAPAAAGPDAAAPEEPPMPEAPSGS
jgi:hypothetical protein